MKAVVLMLEDDDDRLRRFSALLNRVDHVEFKYTKSVHKFKEVFLKLPSPPVLICLDHDLYPEHEYDPDPGDGRMAAQFLASEHPNSHVIIHSSNFEGAESMFYTLMENGWTVEKVAPIGETWIESYWWPIARNLIIDRTTH